MDFFNMPIDFSSFLGGFFEDFTDTELFPLLETTQQKTCKGCGSTFEDIVNMGKFGCPQCYETFEVQIDNLLNKIQGNNRHIGRIGKIEKAKVENSEKPNDDNKKVKDFNNNDKLDKLKEKLKELVKAENYEEAAKIRDQIKELEK